MCNLSLTFQWSRQDQNSRKLYLGFFSTWETLEENPSETEWVGNMLL